MKNYMMAKDLINSIECLKQYDKEYVRISRFMSLIDIDHKVELFLMLDFIIMDRNPPVGDYVFAPIYSIIGDYMISKLTSA